MTDPTPQPKPAYEDAYDWRKPAHESSQIDALAWDDEKMCMMVRFRGFCGKSMAVYAYPHADDEEMDALLKADSPGAAFNVWKRGESAKGYIRLPEEPQPEAIILCPSPENFDPNPDIDPAPED